ncbi:hypothetical protein ABG067_009324, partial [Albugo candida]
TESSHVDIVTKDSETVTVGVIDCGKKTESDIDVITKDSETVTIGVIAGEKTESTDVEIITKDSETVTVIAGGKTETTTEKTTSSGHVEAVVGGIVAGGIIAGTIEGHEDTTKVDIITKDSEVVTVGVIDVEEKT